MGTIFDSLNAACVNTFGEPVVYQQVGSDPDNPPAPVAIKGIVLKDGEEEQASDGRYIRLFLRETDLPTPPQPTETLTVRGIEYTVFRVFIDAHGGVYLALRS
jgi:hypothetical protein